MSKIRAILVDDEESARDVLENLLRRFCPEVELLDKCIHVKQAVESIQKYKPDVVFLDIEMPNYAGYEIVNFFDTVDFEIVFITAYDKYALRAFEVSAVDYLLKPIDIERLKQTVGRIKTAVDVKQYVERVALMSKTLQENEIKNLAISEKGQQHIIAVSSIVAIEAQESYCYVHLLDKKFVVSKNLKHFETIFADTPSFIRVHKSWMVSKEYIEHYSRSNLTITLTNGLTAKLSKYKKTEFETLVLS